MAPRVLFEPFDVVSSGTLGAVSVATPPLLAATVEGFDFFFEAVDVGVLVDVDVDGVTDELGGAEDAAELAAPGFGPAVAAEFTSEVDELDGSAQAIPWWVKRTAPMPTATARPPIQLA